jgi:hypothetical protein
MQRGYFRANRTAGCRIGGDGAGHRRVESRRYGALSKQFVKFSQMGAQKNFLERSKDFDSWDVRVAFVKAAKPTGRREENRPFFECSR